MFKLNDKIYKAFQEFVKRFTHMQKDIGKNTGLNSSEAKVIACLADDENLTHSEIGKMCNADKSAMSRLLSKMEKKDLIESTYKDSNKKSLYARLTEHGKKLAYKIKASYERLVSKYFGKLTSEENKLFFNLFKKLLKEQKV